MPPGIQATGYLGVAFETVEGTYAAPTLYIPLRSESLQFVPEHIYRRNIRGIADEQGAIPGNFRIEGDVEAELQQNALLRFLYASRNTVVKAGASPFTYTFTPGHGAVPPLKTLSVTVVRNGVVFGYTGIRTSSIELTVDDGLLVGTFSLIGLDEAVQTLPTPTYGATVPFGPGQWTIGIPTGTTVTNVDTFSLSVNDNAEAQHRLRTSRAPSFVKWGEREVTLSFEQDFESRADYDAFKAATAQSVRVLASSGATASVQFTLPNAVRNTYEVALSSQGDLVRSSFEYRGMYDDTTSKSYEFVVVSNDNIT